MFAEEEALSNQLTELTGAIVNAASAVGSDKGAVPWLNLCNGNLHGSGIGPAETERTYDAADPCR
ncbi:hypothetical protein [Nonomuraea diastatica]|uniref:Uncharacterized protein n=1 Tax=Nonomuraea diastatica TaxID=1848329 RepID=A0A4R4VNQ5_9ACTN|nr:hypothetical protein [Nonomuraea diastatica]TDD04713.1 hypothetical protein E1294_49960 [Nonomuraea diastatica]